jgi:hypothetical protein
MPQAMHQALPQAMHVGDADKTRQDKTRQLRQEPLTLKTL